MSESKASDKSPEVPYKDHSYEWRVGYKAGAEDKAIEPNAIIDKWHREALRQQALSDSRMNEARFNAIYDCAEIVSDSMNHAIKLSDAHMAEQCIHILKRIVDLRTSIDERVIEG